MKCQKWDFWHKLAVFVKTKKLIKKVRKHSLELLIKMTYTYF